MRLLGFVFTLLSFQCFSQNPEFPELAPNLISNPGFEKLSGTVNPSLEPYLQFRYHMMGWRSPTRTTPDLVWVDEIFVSKGDEEVDDYGYDVPHSGQHAVAIITDNPQVATTRTDTYREYIQTKLKESLKIGERYHIEFWVKKMSNAKLVSNNIGFALGFEKFYNDDYEPLLYLEPLHNENKVINAKKPEWIKIETEFEADSDYSYLTIGNFFDNEKTIVQDYHEGEWNNAYYMVDDVNLYQITNLEPEPIVEESLETIEVEVGKVIELENIFFETAKWDLLPESFVELNELVNLMNLHPTMEIAIMGHTDSRGSASYNLTLSMNRAKAVYDYLIQNEIEAARITSAGFGLERPIATNDTSEGRQMNRRVEFMITKE